jgi:23S rRNA pseudouridine2605 synthase
LSRPKHSLPPTNPPPPTKPPRLHLPTRSSDSGERLQKVLASAGLGSRREIERWIEAGRVKVGDQVAKLGDRALPGAAVFLDGKKVELKAKTSPARLIAYHKPIGELVTRSDPQGRATVFEQLPKLESGRWIAIGRLDLNSSGLLLFTDSGELANQLMHPRQEIEREYEVRVQGGLDGAAMKHLLRGVEIEGGLAKFLRLVPMKEQKDTGTNRWYRAVLAEGRNREVRRLIEAVGGRVSRLRRVRFGSILLPVSLPPGRWAEVERSLTDALVRKFC